MLKIKERITRTYHNLGLAVSAGDKARFLQFFKKLHPYDQAQYFTAQKKRTRLKLYKYLSPKDMANLFADVDADDRRFYIEEMTPGYVSKMLMSMHPDDAVDVLDELSHEQVSKFLALVDDETEQKLRDLLQHGEETAGSIMTTNFVVIHIEDTVESAVRRLKKGAPKAVTIYNAFVVDEEERLLGVVTLRDLLVSKSHTHIHDIIDKRVVSIMASAHQEKAARLIKDYDFLALPVVDKHNHLLGIITVDDVVDVIDQAAAEDYSKFAAVEDGDITDTPLVSAQKRLPWLIILLFLGMLTATLISQFEMTIEKVAILGAFIPVVAGTTGNSGTQALAVVVRAIATGDFEKITLSKHFIREATTAIMTSVVCGIVLASIIYLWKGEPAIGLVAGVSLTFSIFVGTLAGSFVPLFMHKIHIDPAVASGPMITTICDIISMAVYFGIATMFMSHLI